MGNLGLEQRLLWRRRKGPTPGPTGARRGANAAGRTRAEIGNGNWPLRTMRPGGAPKHWQLWGDAKKRGDVGSFG